MKKNFEVIRRQVAKGRVAALGIVMSEIMADLQARLCYVAEAAAGEQFGFEPAPKRFSVGVIVAVTAATHAEVVQSRRTEAGRIFPES